MTVEPLVSVIVTARNAAEFIDDTLASIIASTHQRIEIAVVDDGSTDTTPVIIDRWAQTDSRVRPFQTPAVGRRAALQYAHQEATAELLCWVDADDTIYPTAIAACVTAIDDDHQLVWTNRNLIDPNGQVTGAHQKNKVRYTPTQLLVTNMIFNLRLFTAEVLAAAGGVGELESAIDWDMNLRMVEHTQPRHIPQTLYKYRIHPGRMSGRPEQAAAGATAVRNAIKRRGLNLRLHITESGQWQIRKPRPPLPLTLPPEV